MTKVVYSIAPHSFPRGLLEHFVYQAGRFDK